MPLALFRQLLAHPIARLEQLYPRWTQFLQSSAPLGLALDLTRSKSELLLENAFLRQQLVILHRQVKQLRLTRRDRLSLLLFASRLRVWKQALVILKPDTLLRWHRQGFKLFWRFKTRARPGRPHLSEDLVTLIRQMATENPPGEPNGSAANSSNPDCTLPKTPFKPTCVASAPRMHLPGLEHVLEESCEGYLGL